MADALDEFLRVGRALRQLRDEKLYRSTHANFSAYCEDVFGVSERRARQLIDVVQVDEIVAAAGGAFDASEKVARVVASVMRDQGPERAAEAWHVVFEKHDGNRPPSAAKARAILVDAGILKPPVARRRLEESTRALAWLGREIEKLSGSPLPAELRPLAHKYAGDARRIAAAFDRLATGGSVPPGTFGGPARRAQDPPIPCLGGHGRYRDSQGRCTSCGLSAKTAPRIGNRQAPARPRAGPAGGLAAAIASLR